MEEMHVSIDFQPPLASKCKHRMPPISFIAQAKAKTSEVSEVSVQVNARFLLYGGLRCCYLQGKNKTRFINVKCENGYQLEELWKEKTLTRPSSLHLQHRQLTLRFNPILTVYYGQFLTHNNTAAGRFRGPQRASLQ